MLGISTLVLFGCATDLKKPATGKTPDCAKLLQLGKTEDDKALAELFAEKPIRCVGVVQLQDFPGAPNYEKIAAGDEFERVWVLTAEVDGKLQDYQLVLLEGAAAFRSALRKSVGKKVVIEGFMWQAHNGHHHTPFLITVKSITLQSAGGEGAKP